MRPFFKKTTVRLRSVNLRFFIAIGILCLFLIISTIQLVNQFISYKKTVDLYAEISKIALDLQEGSDYLTEEARFFVLTSDYSHLKNYFYERNENRRREKSIDQLTILHPAPEVVDYLNLALEESHKLEQQEFYSMALIVKANHFDEQKDLSVPKEILNVTFNSEDIKLEDQYKIAKAWILMFSESYMTQKHLISQYKNNALSQIFNYTEDTHKTNYEHLKDLFLRMMIIITLVFVFNLLLFLCIISLVIIPLKNNINNIKDGSRLGKSHTHEFNILSSTYNEMFDRNEANEILLRQRAEQDDLTGLLNRRAYKQLLSALLNGNSCMALILIDVDFFKLINDTYGHPIGDKVLMKVANVLVKNFSTKDYVARIGGDEFAVIISNCDEDKNSVIEIISAKLDAAIKKLAEKEKDLPAVTLSCGIEFSNKGYTEAVYEHADSALYEAKRAGRNGYRFYTDETEKLLNSVKEI